MSTVRIALVRCDATPEIGLGHASRCAALAKALAPLGYRAMFVGELGEEAIGLLPETASVVRDPGSAGALIELARDADASAIVVDGYGFDATYLDVLAPQRTRMPLVVIDDFAATPLPAETIVVNFTLGAERLDYPGERLTVLRGPEYLLLDRSFTDARRSAQPPREPPRLAVVSLGSAGDGAVPTVVGALVSAMPDLELVVVGGRSEVRGATVRRIPSAPTLAPLMAEADLCVLGGGLTKYEAAYLGRPAAVLSRSTREAADTAVFVEHALVHDLGQLGVIEPSRLDAGVRRFATHATLRQRLAAAARALFPDHPADRAAEVVDRLIRASDLARSAR